MKLNCYQIRKKITKIIVLSYVKGMLYHKGFNHQKSHQKAASFGTEWRTLEL